MLPTAEAGGGAEGRCGTPRRGSWLKPRPGAAEGGLEGPWEPCWGQLRGVPQDGGLVGGPG